MAESKRQFAPVPFMARTLGQIQLKLTYVAILCSAKPRTTGNLTQRPAKPNCFSPLPTSSFGLSAQAAHMTQSR